MFKSIKKRLKDQRGLTLVELLAVIVILGIIAGIAVPNIGKIIDKTEDDAKVAEAIQIIQAAKLYATSKKLSFSDDPDTDKVTENNVLNIDTTQLGDYLDNINSNGYKVKIVKGAKGKYSYFISNHSSVGLVDSSKDNLASESELLAY